MNNFKCFAIDHRSVRENSESSLVHFFHPEEREKNWERTQGKFGADYGELRALESFSKSEYPYGGVFHYRRVLLLSRPTDSEVIRKNWEGEFLPYWNWSYTPEFAWNAESIATFAKERKIFIPEAVDVDFDGHSNLYEQFLPSHPKIIFDKLLETWAEAEEFIAFLKLERKLIPYNMAILPRQEAIELCDWLFPILNSLEEKLIPLSADKYNRRWPGFLAERLVTYYWMRVARDKNIQFTPVGRLDEALEIDFFLASGNSKCGLTGFDGNYILPAFNMIDSVARNVHGPLDFMCLTTVTEENFSEYVLALEPRHSDLRIHYVQVVTEGKKIPWQQEGNWPLAALFRFLAPTLTDGHLITWFDGDTITTGDVSSLWEEWHPEFAVTASQDLFASWVRHVKYPSSILSGESWENYYSRNLPQAKFPIIYQAGILVMNLNNWRENFAVSKLLSIASRKRFPGGHDQDLLNIFFEGKFKVLSQRFNYVNQWHSDVISWSKIVSRIELTGFKEWLELENPQIIHYTGYLIPKPFNTTELSLPGFQRFWAASTSSPFLPSLLIKISEMSGEHSNRFISQRKSRKIRIINKSTNSNTFKTTLFLLSFKLYSSLPLKSRNSKLVAYLKQYLKKILAS